MKMRRLTIEELTALAYAEIEKLAANYTRQNPPKRASKKNRRKKDG